LHGKTIRVQGQIDECISLDCQLCTDGSREATCLPFSLWSGKFPEYEKDPDGWKRALRAQDMVEELYRFATVTADAWIDATCELGYDPAKGRDPNETIVCTDRSSAIEDARVVSVDVRRAATEGRFDAYEGEPLRQPTNSERKRITDGWLARELKLDSHAKPRQVEVFIFQVGQTPKDSEIVACECLDDDCRGRWPTKEGHVWIESPANPYRCELVSQLSTNWTFTK